VALCQLEVEKLICLVPHRGPGVASITLREARDICALRRMLDSFAAHEFTRPASGAQALGLVMIVARARALKKIAALACRKPRPNATDPFESCLHALFGLAIPWERQQFLSALHDWWGRRPSL
jgi:hypothetical protein